MRGAQGADGARVSAGVAGCPSADSVAGSGSAGWASAGAGAGVVRVPGAWETPLVVSRLAKSKKVDAIVALGAVIRGSTPHFDYVASEVSKGVAQVSMSTGVPVTFGVLTTDTIEQAVERAGTKAGNKGWDAAASAIEMVSLGKALSSHDF